MSFTTNLGQNVDRLTGNKWSNDINDYLMISAIGKGSFGQVFKAIDKSDTDSSQSKYCAVKWIAKKSSPNIGKILTEVSIHLRVKHDNILQLFNVIEDKNHVYLVLELCFGGALSQLVHHKAREDKTSKQSKSDQRLVSNMFFKSVLEYSVVRNVIKQLCSGLEYLHRNSIVHRDLNLNNILLLHPFISDSTFVVKIADFGLAIDLNTCSLQHISVKPHREEHVIPLPMGTTICGTPGFISPEVWSQMQTVSPKSDIFSLGSILFSCIAGYTPKGEIDLNDFSPIVSDLITRLLAPNPTDRPSIDDIVNHPFVLGPLTTERLMPINKKTKALNLSIEGDGKVFLQFLKNKSTVVVSRDGLEIQISAPNEESKFIDLVKGKTPKVTVHPNDQDVIKCCLMENNDFEVTLYRPDTNQTTKMLLNDHNTIQDPVLRKRIQDLYSFCLKTEKDFEMNQKCNEINCFPVSFGRKSKIKCDSSQSHSSQQQFISSQTLRSILIDGIGEASQLSNGVFNVFFTDGSSLNFRTDCEFPVIFRPRNGTEKRFRKNEVLPDYIKDKLSLLPDIIDKLRQSQR